MLDEQSERGEVDSPTAGAEGEVLPASEAFSQDALERELGPLSELQLHWLIRHLADALTDGGDVASALEGLLEQAAAGEGTLPMTAVALRSEPRLRALAEALLAGLRCGESMSAVLERYRLLLPDDLRYAVYVGERLDLLEDALGWFLGGLFSSVPVELRRLDLLELYLKAGAAPVEMLEEDLFLSETPWARDGIAQLEAMTAEEAEPFAELFADWRIGRLVLDPPA